MFYIGSVCDFEGPSRGPDDSSAGCKLVDLADEAWPVAITLEVPQNLFLFFFRLRMAFLKASPVALFKTPVHFELHATPLPQSQWPLVLGAPTRG